MSGASPAGGQRELHEPVGDLAGVDRLEPHAATDRHQPAAWPSAAAIVRIRSWNWVARSVVHGRAGDR